MDVLADAPVAIVRSNQAVVPEEIVEEQADAQAAAVLAMDLILAREIHAVSEIARAEIAQQVTARVEIAQQVTAKAEIVKVEIVQELLRQAAVVAPTGTAAAVKAVPAAATQTAWEVSFRQSEISSSDFLEVKNRNKAVL